jgi:hypothetical protein
MIPGPLQFAISDVSVTAVNVIVLSPKAVLPKVPLAEVLMVNVMGLATTAPAGASQRTVWTFKFFLLIETAESGGKVS